MGTIEQKTLVVLGFTASGKSELAVKIARRFNGEIISADSRQVYRGMDIGTGKVPNANQVSKIRNQKYPKLKNRECKYFSYKGIPHHLIDVASPKRTFTVARYQKLAKKALQDITKRGKLPIICGGTGFYIDALVNAYELPNVPPQKNLRRKLERETCETLYARLLALDSARAENIDPKNKRRLIRVLEIILVTGKPIPNLIANPARSPEKRGRILKIGIDLPKEKLERKIYKRLIVRLKEGMIQEVQNLRDSGVSWNRLDNFGLEYRWVSRYLQDLVSKKEMIEKLNKDIIRYAKRQRCWFKRDKEICWVKNTKESKILVRKFLAA